MAQAGHPALIYDWNCHRAAEQAVFHGRNIPYYGWHYPPFFLLIALPLAALPYGWSLLGYLAATFAGYAATLWKSCGMSAMRCSSRSHFPAYSRMRCMAKTDF